MFSEHRNSAPSLFPPFLPPIHTESSCLPAFSLTVSMDCRLGSSVSLCQRKITTTKYVCESERERKKEEEVVMIHLSLYDRTPPGCASSSSSSSFLSSLPFFPPLLPPQSLSSLPSMTMCDVISLTEGRGPPWLRSCRSLFQNVLFQFNFFFSLSSLSHTLSLPTSHKGRSRYFHSLLFDGRERRGHSSRPQTEKREEKRE